MPKPNPNYGTCPTCKQALLSDTARRRVERAQAAAERREDELRESIREEVESEYAAQFARMRTRAVDLERLTDQRNAHDRGIAHEVDVLGLLRSAFPADEIDHYGRTGDIAHTVVHRDRDVGLILYECKNHGKWSSDWLTKLKQDGRKRSTSYLILVPRQMPAKISGFGVIDDIVVTQPMYAVAVATIMRRVVVADYRSGTAANGVPEKARRLYDYLASPEFRVTFDAIRGYADKLEAQDKTERRQHERNWAKRAKLVAELLAAPAELDAGIEAETENTGVVVNISKKAVLSDDGPLKADRPRRRQAARRARGAASPVG
jgi:hypothetical protein